MDEKNRRTVFISYIHDDKEAATTLAEFIKKLGLKPIVLDEQPSKGQTIIDKFEEHADEAGFAIVLLTPDDVGSSKATGERRLRARQNVILELGYFFGSLGSERVCALYKGGVELLSDISGLIYIPMDSDNNWQLKIGKEMMNAGLPVESQERPVEEPLHYHEEVAI
ncbi:MAG: nucleotide-binding protein [Candidatus Poribacteria bacterium]|nr:nucleotide-binding protein [Candidatus Poribacteria bacterium]